MNKTYLEVLLLENNNFRVAAVLRFMSSRIIRVVFYFLHIKWTRTLIKHMFTPINTGGSSPV